MAPVLQFACHFVDCCVAKPIFYPSFLKMFNFRLGNGAIVDVAAVKAVVVALKMAAVEVGLKMVFVAVSMLFVAAAMMLIVVFVAKMALD
eukprot:8239467-Ditylum_brightwellii.AAC.1